VYPFNVTSLPFKRGAVAFGSPENCTTMRKRRESERERERERERRERELGGCPKGWRRGQSAKPELQSVLYALSSDFCQANRPLLPKLTCNNRETTCFSAGIWLDEKSRQHSLNFSHATIDVIAEPLSNFLKTSAAFLCTIIVFRIYRNACAYNLS